MQRSNRVREVRRGRDMTQERLAALAGISRWTLIRVESHPGHQVSGDVMRRLARSLGTDLNTLFWTEPEAEVVA